MARILAALGLALLAHGTAFAAFWLGDHDGPAAAPEIDPASAAAALTLLGGVIAVMRGRRKQ